MTLNVKAVYALYSNAVKTKGDKAFDVNGNEINLYIPQCILILKF